MNSPSPEEVERAAAMLAGLPDPAQTELVSRAQLVLDSASNPAGTMRLVEGLWAVLERSGGDLATGDQLLAMALVADTLGNAMGSAETACGASGHTIDAVASEILTPLQKVFPCQVCVTRITASIFAMQMTRAMGAIRRRDAEARENGGKPDV